MQEFLDFAHALADAAGGVIRPCFGGEHPVEAKSDFSPVTRADREAEQAMRALIAARYPEHGMCGEEFGTEGADRDYVWVLDPIDGTRAFIAGKKEWGTLIALCHEGIPILGLLDQPVTGERWYALAGGPTHCRTGHQERLDMFRERANEGIALPLRAGFAEKQVHAAPCPDLAAARISTTSAAYFNPVQAKRFIALADRCREVIEGGDCYAYGMLARGERDIVIDAGLKPYDILALVPIIEGAGGKITGWDGSAVTLANFSEVIAVGDGGLDLRSW